MWMRTGTWRSGAATSWRLSGGPTAKPRCRWLHAYSRCCPKHLTRAAEQARSFSPFELALRLQDQKIKIAVDQSGLNVKGVGRNLKNVNDNLVARDAACLGKARVIIAPRGAARGRKNHRWLRQCRSG